MAWAGIILAAAAVQTLTAKYYQPQSGRVTIGGQDIRDIPAEQVLERISLVDQDVFLFNDTVRNNIRYARPGAADQILVLDGGRVAEAGTRNQLFAKGGKYAAMWEASQLLN